MRTVGVVLLLVLGVGLPAAAEPAEIPRAPIGGPITFEPSQGTMLQLAGKGPYRGTLHVRAGSGGISVVNDVDLESYVMGLAEVPGSWPMEALKAQAVAARTYALWEKERGSWSRQGYDVCATTTCQVYAGASVERGERGRRWVEAVKATRGEVLLYKGRPALARYHASSGGQTLPNERVFPKSGEIPYLRAVRDSSDRVSPLYEWQVRFTLEEMSDVLHAGFGISGPIAEITADEDERVVTVRNAAREVRLPVTRFRSVVSAQAPKLFPDKYPGLRSDGRSMPLTLPSSRFVVERDEEGFRIDGRGYGHGVGMSQWGARGRAERGDDYRKILGAYYGGLEPARWTGSDRLRVGIVGQTDAVTLTGDGAFAVRAAGDVLASSTVGAWSVSSAGGRVLRVAAPDGYLLPLVLSAIDVPDRVSIDRSAHEVALDVTFVLPKAARIDAVLSGAGGAVARADEVFEAGSGRMRVTMDAGKLPGSGGYRLTLTAFDGRRRTSKTVPVHIDRPGAGPLVPAAIAIGLLLLAGMAVLRNSRPEPELPRVLEPVLEPAEP